MHHPPAPQNIPTIFANIRGLLIDMDGVIYQGSKPIPGAVQAIDTLKDRFKILMLTNNSSKEAGPLASFLQSKGFELQAQDILIVTEVICDYLKTHYPTKTILVIGEPHFRTMLNNSGLRTVGPEHWTKADLVLCGNSKDMNRTMLEAGLNALHKGAIFLLSNPDKLVNKETGYSIGTGAFGALLESLSGVSPIVIGKPEAPSYKYALKKLGLTPAETAMIGDNPETDIAGAVNNNLTGVLVLSGIAKTSSPLAHITIDSIADLAKALA